jgi:hypothetical protein
MNHRTRVICPPPRAWWRPPTRTAVAVIATAGLALPVAASGASPPTGLQKAVAYSSCMRSHGVPRFPDPTSSGVLPKVSLQQLGVSAAQLQSAETACRRLLPSGGSRQQQDACLMLATCPAAEVRQILAAERKYARCMRAHGVPNWPDPTLDPQGMPVFDVTRAGIGRQFIHSSLFRSPNGECERLTGGAPVPRE